LSDASGQVPWIPTPKALIEVLFSYVINVGPRDVVLDLGCGDGRTVVYAASRGARGVCIEINRVLCNIAEISAQLRGVQERVRVVCKDFFSVDLGEFDPSIVYAYLYPSVLEALSTKFERELRPGTLVVSLDFSIRGWSPILVKKLVDEYDHVHAVWMYVIGVSNPGARVASISSEFVELAKRLSWRSISAEV